MSAENFSLYVSLWSKYLPVIRILLKKSLAAEQDLALNAPDFHRAGLTRKSGYRFDIILNNAKPEQVIVDSPLASALVYSLQQDAAIRSLCQDRVFRLALSPSFQFTMKHMPQALPEESLAESTQPEILPA